MRSLLMATTEPHHSPPIVTLFAGAFAGAAIGKILDELEKYVKERLTRARVIDSTLELLLDPAEDTQFLLGERWDEVAERDLETALCFLENLSFHHGPPTVKVEESSSGLPEISSNLFLFGNPIANPITGIFTGNISLEEAAEYKINIANLSEDRLLSLPYTFGLQEDPRYERQPLSKLGTIKDADPPVNFVIKKRENGRVFAPRYSFSKEYYDRDYLMVAKVPNLHASGIIRGTKAIIVAGCHGVGTEAAQRLLVRTRNCRELLRELRQEVGPRDFQAIFQVLVPESYPEGEKVDLELFDVTRL